jgi:hypothetical protein
MATDRDTVDEELMRNFGVRYGGLLGIVMTLFATFVACGSQLYRVTLTGDGGSRPAAIGMASNADSNQDPSSPSFGLHAPGGWNALPVHFRTDYRMTAAQIQGLMKAMTTWELAAGRKLFAYDGPHDGITGDSFRDLYSSLDDGINGHYLDDHWGKTGKPDVVLATTIWDNDPADASKIVTADIRYNGEHYVFGDSLVLHSPDQREVVDIQTLATHELGHLLGLAHIRPEIDPDSIMVPALYIGEGMANRRLSAGDIDRIHKIYGCQGDACDVEKTLAAVENWVREPTDAPTDVNVTAH